mgnify:CR=1 FL=1
MSEDAAERSCVLWTEYLCPHPPPPNPCVKILTPRVMALGGGGLGAMRMEPKRGSRELSHAFCPVRTQWKGHVLSGISKRALIRSQLYSCLDLGHSDSKTMRKKFLLAIKYPIHRTLHQDSGDARRPQVASLLWLIQNDVGAGRRRRKIMSGILVTTPDTPLQT